MVLIDALRRVVAVAGAAAAELTENGRKWTAQGASSLCRTADRWREN